MKTKTGKWTQKGQGLPNLTENEAREHLESLLWPTGSVCPHCGGKDVYRLAGKGVRPGLLHCRKCREQFTVTVGTIFEDSHLPLATWVRAFHLMATSKKGISALQLQRNLGLGSYRTAWHLAHRIRLAMKCEPFAQALQGDVEVDETYVGGKPRPGTGYHKRGRGTKKTPVVALVQRDGNAHCNPEDGSGLSKRQVLTPHFHRINDAGVEVAYRSDLLNRPSDANRIVDDCTLGLEHFCQEARLACSQQAYPDLIIKQGVMDLSSDDPLNGVSFR